MTHPALPPGWYADPAGQSDQRYYDGVRWTEHIIRAGVQSASPIALPTSPAASFESPPAAVSPVQAAWTTQPAENPRPAHGQVPSIAPGSTGAGPRRFTQKQMMTLAAVAAVIIGIVLAFSLSGGSGTKRDRKSFCTDAVALLRQYPDYTDVVSTGAAELNAYGAALDHLAAESPDAQVAADLRLGAKYSHEIAAGATPDIQGAQADDAGERIDSYVRTECSYQIINGPSG
jgi:Protein of unknown function (DUF2510)